MAQQRQFFDHYAYVVVACLVVPAFIGTPFIREVPLRTQGGIEAQRSAEVEGDRAMAETAIV